MRQQIKMVHIWRSPLIEELIGEGGHGSLLLVLVGKPPDNGFHLERGLGF